MTDTTVKIDEQKPFVGMLNTNRLSNNKNEKEDSVSPIREKPDMRSWKPRRPSETIHADAGSRLFHLRRLSDA